MKTPYIILLIIFAMTLAGAASRAPDLVKYKSPLPAAAILDQATFTEWQDESAPALPEMASSTGIKVPILVYHVVRPRYPSDTRSVRGLAQTPEVFDAQMAHLQDAGYHVITLSELENALALPSGGWGAPLPAKPIVLTFDDGWRDQFVYALPILEKYHYPATFFIFTNAIGHRDFMTLDNLKELIAAGMTIGDHSRSHPFLTRIKSEARLEDEIVGSKQLLESELGVPIREFAYPFGQYDASTTALVRAAGFGAARGDYYTGAQSEDKRYALSAMNAPTTVEKFDQYFP